MQNHEETISEGLRRLGYTHRRDEWTKSDSAHVIEKNGVYVARMRADGAAALIAAEDSQKDAR